MNGFVYFVVGPAAGISPSRIRDAGLGYAFSENEGGELVFSAVGVLSGPDGRGGLAIAPGESVQYSADYSWLPLPGRDDVLVGVDREAMPTAAELERETMLPGHLVKLGDGGEWLAPVARAAATTDVGRLVTVNSLPSRSVPAGDGRWISGEVFPQYRELWAVAERWGNRWGETLPSDEDIGEEVIEAKLDVSGCHNDAVAVLAANYRVGPAECGLLGLFDSEGAFAVEALNALIDLPTVFDYLKKKQRCDSSNMSDGSADSGASTPRASVI